MTKALPNKNLVLYADDDRDDIELVRDAFQIYSHSTELKTFQDGVELLDHVSKLNSLSPQPCLIILDINMPRLNGKEVLARLRNIDGFANTPVVLFSTSTLPSEMAFAKTFDAGFLTKPLCTEHIHLLVEKMIDHCSDEARNNIKRLRG